MLAYDAQLKILNDMVNPQKKKRARKKKQPPIGRLSMWEWDTLVAAWRYYERVMTITSASFPRDIIQRFWGKGNPYSDEVRDTIANQFAITDHGSKGEKDWTELYKAMDCDLTAWITFYRFCEAWCKGFEPLKVRYKNNNGEWVTDTIEAFHTDYKDRWFDKEGYIAYGAMCYINPKRILCGCERCKK